jgi:hypothetical protein
VRARLLLVALLLLAACSGDDGNGPPPPPPNLTGELAYISGGAIVIRNFPDGSTRRIELNTEGLVVEGLAWQPDGGALVYAQNTVERLLYELHRVPVDGSPATVLYQTELQHQAWPAFAPDGRLGYWVNGLDHGYTMFVDGEPFSAFEGHCQPSRPAWSPDGSVMLVVERAEGADRLVQVNLATGAAVVVFQAGDQSVEQLVNPAYSRSGDRVAFTRAVFGQNNGETDEIWVINADGSNPFRLTSRHSDQEATWSPDDAWIAFARNDPSGPSGMIIAVVSSVGGSVTRLSQGDGFAPAWR